MRSLLDQAPHYHVHQQKPFHLNTAASVVIVFCGLGASISFMVAVALYFWCFKNRDSSSSTADAAGDTQQNASAAENRVIREKISKRLVDTLPVATLQSVCDKNRSSAECCSVCLTEFRDAEPASEEGLRIRQLPDCGHFFHTECIQLWLASYLSCPLCRANLILEEDRTHNPAFAASVSSSEAGESAVEATNEQHLVIEAAELGAEGTSESPFKVNSSS